MEPVALLYPPVLLIGVPAPGAWPPSPEQKVIHFSGLVVAMHDTVPHPQNPQMRVPALHFTHLGDWPLRVDSWASAKEPEQFERSAYMQWRAAQAGIQLAGADDPLFKNGPGGAAGGPSGSRKLIQ